MICFLEKSRAAPLGLVTEFLALRVQSLSWREWVGGRGKRRLWSVKTKVSRQTGLMRGLVWKTEKKL